MNFSILTSRLSTLIFALLVLCLAGPPSVLAKAGEGASSAGAAQLEDDAVAEQSISMAEIVEMLQRQQEELAEQKKLLARQTLQIEELTKQVKVLKTTEPVAAEEMVAQSEKVESTAPESEGYADIVSLTGDDEEISAREREQKSATTGQAVAEAQADDPTLALLNEFRGGWRLPGTDAALAIGGYVKASVVYNNDPLELKDRFIVGSIPVGEGNDENLKAQSSITALQSRLNFDLREATEYGVLRAFIEGDFAGEGNQYRLRHAFGQWRRILAGQTWSAFVDTQASPEEVDFEGLNGRINVRQSQVRLMPQLGEKYQFQFSLEDPNPQIQNGSGVTRTPDLIATGRFQPNGRLHTKLAFMVREIRAQRDQTFGGGVESEVAWGLSASGRYMTPGLDDRDSLVFQLSAGNGIGRYVNDLSSVGNYDGIFNPDDGELELYDVVSGYLSWQHWWGRDQLRSNFTFGVVQLDNPGFVDADAYEQTLRLSGNLFWSPTPRIDLGAEMLWGQRENEGGDSNTASQVQLSLRYRF